MTHITDGRDVGNHGDMGGPPPVASRISVTVTEILRAGVNRRTRRRDMASAQSAWDSEGGAAERGATDGEGGSVPDGAEGLPQTPTRLGH